MSTETRTKNMRALHAQLNALRMMDDKVAILKTITDNRTGSARELTDAELQKAVDHLSQYRPKPKPGDKMRKAIISMAHEMGWRVAGKADMQRINNWCVASGKFHKRLNDHSLTELTALVSQFKIVYEKHLKTL